MSTLPIVTLYSLQLLSGDAPRTLHADEPLHSGDQIGVQLALNEPRYVYLVQLDEGGVRKVIFPNKDQSAPYVSGDAVTLPREGAYFTIPQLAESDRVTLIFSTETLKLDGNMLLAENDSADRPPPPERNTTNRPLDMEWMDLRVLPSVRE